MKIYGAIILQSFKLKWLRQSIIFIVAQGKFEEELHKEKRIAIQIKQLTNLGILQYSNLLTLKNK